MVLGLPEGDRRHVGYDNGEQNRLENFYGDQFDGNPESGEHSYDIAIRECTRADIHAFAKELVGEVA